MGDLMNTTTQISRVGEQGGEVVLLVQMHCDFLPQTFEYFLVYMFAVQVNWLNDDMNGPHKPDKNGDFYDLR